MAKKYKIKMDLDYVQGHLRYGHYEGELELTDEELKDLKNNPDNWRYELNFKLDDFEVDDCGPVTEVIIEEA